MIMQQPKLDLCRVLCATMQQNEFTASTSPASSPSLLARLRVACDNHTEAELLSMACRSLHAPAGGASRGPRADSAHLAHLLPYSPTPVPPSGSCSPLRSSAGPPPSPMRRKALTLTRLGRFPSLVPPAAVASPPMQLGSPRRRCDPDPAFGKRLASLLTARPS